MGCPCDCNSKKVGRYRFKFSASLVDGMDHRENDKDQLVEALNFYYPNRILNGIEIGTMCAATTLKILERCKVEKLITIDAWKHMSGKGHEAENSQDWHDNERKIALNVLKPYANRVSIMRMHSHDALQYIKTTEEQFDFIWIDGGHDFLTVVGDLENSWPLLKKDGFIGGTNFMQILEVTVAVGKFFKEKNLPFKKGGDFTWWYKHESS